MLPAFEKIKGIHPGAVLKRELNKRGIKSSEFANSLNEYKQTFSAILNEKRRITPNLSIKLARRLDVPNDYFMLLQASHDVKKANSAEIRSTPDLSNFRKVIFWDTDINTIDWDKNRRAVIQRILERGNQKEIEEMIAFYGKQTVSEEVKSVRNSFLPSFKYNAKKYDLISE